MEISGKVIKILEPQTFVSQKTQQSYTKHAFVLETQGQYPKKIAFSVMTDERFNAMQIAVGATYNVNFDVESREWKGRFFTECTAWKVMLLNGGGTSVPSHSQQNGGAGDPNAPF